MKWPTVLQREDRAVTRPSQSPIGRTPLRSALLPRAGRRATFGPRGEDHAG
jgi:hypothetical protein